MKVGGLNLKKVDRNTFVLYFENVDELEPMLKKIGDNSFMMIQKLDIDASPSNFSLIILVD